MALFTETIDTEQLWSRRAMGMLWAVKENLDSALVNKLDVLYKSRQKDSVLGKTKIKYTLGGKDSVAGKLGFGRLYSTGFETFESEARGTLCADYYYDVDVKNCHPTLMFQFAKKLFDSELIECKKFCENRQKFYDEIAENKEEAKSAIFQILYGGACRFQSLIPFKEECESLAIKLTKHTEYIQLWKQIQNKENALGSFLSYILQTEERKVMLCFRQFFIEKGWSVDVLCYDGIMVRKNKEKQIDATLLREAEGVVLQKTGYRIELEIKPFSKYQITESEVEGKTEIVPGITLSAWKERKEEWEKNHFYYTETNTYAEVRTDGSLFFLDKDHAKTYFYDNFFYKLSDKYNDILPLFPLWLSDANKRVIHTIDFAPSDDPKVYVRPLTWKFQSQNLPQSTQVYVDAFRELVAVNTSRNNQHTTYVLNYIADILQHPFRCPRVALLFIGNQGAGKDTLWEFIGSELLGSLYYSDYETNEQFFAPHDTGRQEKFLVKLQEADPNFCRKNSSALKGLITSPTHKFNPKGKTEFIRKNYMRLILTTNKGNPLELEQSDRRWVPFVNTNEYISNKPRLLSIINLLKQPGAARAIADYLLAINLENFSPENVPENEFKQSIQETEKSAEERFIEWWSGEGTISTDFFTQYRDYCIENSLHYCNNTLSFGRKLLIFIATGKLKKEKRRDGVYYLK